MLGQKSDGEIHYADMESMSMAAHQMMKSVFLLVVLSCYAAFAPSSWAKTPGEVNVGSRLGDAQLNGLTVPSKMLSAYRGRPLIINVWASWCAPCRQEMGSLDRLARRYGRKQFNVIGISTDDDIEAAYLFLEKSGTSFDNYIDRKLLMENMLGADRLPLTILVDRQGRVLSKHVGAKDWDSAEAKLLIEKAFAIKM